VAPAAASARTPADAPLASRSVAGVPLRITAADPALGARVERWLARGLALGNAPPVGAPVWLQVSSDTSRPEPPAGAREIAASPRCRVLRAGDRVFLQLPQACCEIDLAAGRGRLWLADGWWQEPLKTQQDPWVLALVWLLRERGRYALHASAVARDGRGLLIAGDSGSGKSTTALSLIAAGWDWLADDVVLLGPGAPAWLYGVARGFAFHPAVGERLQGLSGEAAGDKHFADVAGTSAGRWTERCSPAAVLLPRVTGGAVSRLEPLSSAEALMALLPASGGIVAGGARGLARDQLDALGALTSQVPNYRLHAGQDIFGDGAALQTLLAARGIGVSGDPVSIADRSHHGA
jgi:hypothetical protein